LGGLGEVTGSIRPPAREGRPSTLKPSPLSDKGAFLLHGTASDPLLSVKSAGGMVGVLARLQASLDRVEQRQMAALNSMEESYEWKARRMRGVLSDLGVDVGKAAGAEAGRGMGGPFVPARLASDAGSFERQLQRISTA